MSAHINVPTISYERAAEAVPLVFGEVVAGSLGVAGCPPARGAGAAAEVLEPSVRKVL